MSNKKVRDLSHKPGELDGKFITLFTRNDSCQVTVESPQLIVSTQQVHLVSRKNVQEGQRRSFGSGTTVLMP